MFKFTSWTLGNKSQIDKIMSRKSNEKYALEKLPRQKQAGGDLQLQIVEKGKSPNK